MALAPLLRACGVLALFALPTCQAGQANNAHRLSVNQDMTQPGQNFEQNLAAKMTQLKDKEEPREVDERSIQIRTVTECAWINIGPQGCFTPTRAYPTSPHDYMQWNWEKQYTVTWSNVDDDYSQQFQWDTGYCGAVNKTIPKGERSLEFSFKQLAAELPKSQCDYSPATIQRLANSASNSIRMEQPESPHASEKRPGIGPFAIFDEDTIKAIKALKTQTPKCPSCEAPDCDSQTAPAYYPAAAISFFFVAAIVAFYAGTRFAKRDRGVKL